MILQKKIKDKYKGYGKLAPAFLDGAEFALENQWISVEDSLPYEYPELLGLDATVPVLTKTDWLGCFVQCMYYNGRDWEFSDGGGVSHWMPIPEAPEE